MNLREFFHDALSQRSDCIAYYVSSELAHMFPDRAIVEGDAGWFDVEGFARAELCTSIDDDRVHNHLTTRWRGAKTDLSHKAENAWFNVWWRNSLLDVLLLTWSEGGCLTRHRWIVAENRGIAEAFLRAVCEWSSEVRGEILVFNNGYWGKSEEMFEAIKGASFDNLVLPVDLKRELREDLSRFFSSQEVYKRYGIPWKRGVLFVGPPGNGKTYAVKGLINELKQPCLYVKSFKSYWDTDQENMRDVFSRARKTTPCILVMEDLDSLVNDKSRAFFLNELDGFEANTGMLVLGTTNHPDRLDPAIVDRPGRFDRKYYFQLPSVEGRLAYLRRWRESLQSELRCSDEVLQQVADRTVGFSFAYLKELSVSAMTAWISEGSRPMDEVLQSTAVLLENQLNAGTGSKKKHKGKKKKTKTAVGGGSALWE